MAKEISNGAFGGAGSFMTNYYAIWRKGLDEEPPNWYGVKQGETYAQRMFYDKSMAPQSSFYKFYSYLRVIANKEAQKERAMLEQHINNVYKNGLNGSQLQAIQKAVDQDNFGMAYTLILKSKEEYEELVREFHGGKFRNISHTNSFWNKQFSSFLKRKFDSEVEIQGEKLSQKLDSNSNMTIDSLVEEWAQEMLYNSEGAVVSSIFSIKEQIKDDLLKHFQKMGAENVSSIYDNIFGPTNDITSLTKRKSVRGKVVNGKKGRKRTLSGLTREITDLIGSGVGKGLSQELATISEQGKKGVSFGTGKLMKYIKNEFTGREQEVYQKGDSLSFLLFEGSFDLQKAASEFFNSEMEPTKQQLELFEKKIVELANNSDKIFKISTNVKGYRSRFDLTIAKEASYSQRMSDLIHMSQQATGLPPLSMEKLAFMFVNTMPGCLQENRIHHITDYVAAICAAWLWDDYGEIFSTEEDSGPIQKIRMFSSGGIYYSASQLINRAADELLDISQDGSDNFVKITFTPPTFEADSYYSVLKDQYPMPARDVTKEEWQGQLKKRWDAMRDRIMSEGKIHIGIVQKDLEKILGELSLYI